MCLVIGRGRLLFSHPGLCWGTAVAASCRTHPGGRVQRSKVNGHAVAWTALNPGALKIAIRTRVAGDFQ